MRPKAILWAARGLLLFLFAVNCYRAATQSITTDEAYTYNRSVSVPIPKLWESFDANDHVLHTLMCKVTVGLLGLSEFTLRIPSLLGGLLLFWALYRLSRLVFGDRWTMLMAVALVALNPLVLDYCSIARGYGLAAALLLFSLYHLLRQMDEPHRRWRLYAAGVGLALSVVANLTLVVPGLVLAFVFAGQYIGHPAMERNWPRVKARANAVLDYMVVPGAVITVLMLAIPLAPAKRELFYVGEPTLARSSLQLVQAMLWRPGNFQATDYHQRVRFRLSQFWAWWFLPAVLIGGGVLAFWKRWRPLTFVWSLTAGTIAVLWLLNAGFGVLWPIRRTGLYFVPLLTLLAVMMFTSNGKWLRVGGAAVGLFVLSEFIINWNVRFYDEWMNESGNEQVMDYLFEHSPKDAVLEVVVAPGYYYQSILFYKRMDRAGWLDVRKAEEGGHCFVLGDASHDLIEKEKLRLVWHQRHTGVKIAIRDGCLLVNN